MAAPSHRQMTGYAQMPTAHLDKKRIAFGSPYREEMTDRPDGDATGVVTGAGASFFQPAAEQPDRGDHAERDRQPVQVETDGPDLDRVERRAGNARDQDVTCFTKPATMSTMASRSTSTSVAVP